MTARNIETPDAWRRYDRKNVETQDGTVHTPILTSLSFTYRTECRWSPSPDVYFEFPYGGYIWTYVVVHVTSLVDKPRTCIECIARR